ncbi:MAG: hypothetical protein WD554_04895 [Flavobacteriaceae bacterium]
MSNRKIRYVDSRTSGNVGFTHEEIVIIEKQLNINKLSIFRNFLLNAGKKSNVLDNDFKNVQEFIELQEHFRNQIKTENNLKFNLNNICCFHTTKDDLKNKIYYFIETNIDELPTVYYYSNGTVPLTGELRDDRRIKIGVMRLSLDFVEFLNIKTEKQFGASLWVKAKRIFYMILIIPLLPLFILFYGVYYLLSGKYKENYS